ncbi:MAG: serine/threonine protein kinase, partial [Acidimicrobiaceae bacterium]|nr:serine/threonine protein kinase [Acidimicrobiaceae bacterium]
MSEPIYAPEQLVVGRYLIAELVGTGPTVEVYRARDRVHSREVALQALRPYLGHTEEVRRRFRSQIVRAARLHHPHLVAVFDGGQSGGVIFQVTEFLAGGSLDDLLRERRALGLDDAVRLGRDVAAALAYLHEEGVVHGEISPSKILFDLDGTAKLSDVSLSGLNRERFATPFAAVRYASPQHLSGAAPHPTDDVYALAVIVFEVATGTSPIDGLSVDEVRAFRNLRSLPSRPELGPLNEVLQRATTPDALTRMSAEEFRDALDTLVTGESLFRRPPSEPAPTLLSSPPTAPRSSIGFHAPRADEVAGQVP